MDGQVDSLGGPVGPELLGQILDEHAAALELYARQWCDVPQDVVQESLLQLARQKQTPRPVLPWLYRVVRNRAISAGRSARRRKHHESQAAARVQPWLVPSPGTRHDAQVLSAALAQLPLEQREPIVAHLWGGLSFAEIGELAGTSASTAHRRYEAGLAAIRERTGTQCPQKT